MRYGALASPRELMLQGAADGNGSPDENLIRILEILI